MADAQKTGKPLPVSGASAIKFGTEYFWYNFLATNKTRCILVLIYGTSFLVRVFGADFWYVCHGQELCLRMLQCAYHCVQL